MFEPEAAEAGAQHGLNRLLSVEIYNQLMNGKMVNRTTLTEGALRSNPLFEELLNHFDRYLDHYALMGYELVLRDGFAFVRSLDMSESKDELARSIQGILLVLFRGVMELGLTMDALLKDSAGLSNAHIEEIGTMQDKQEVLLACGMKVGSLLDHIKKLETRNIAFRNAKGYLVLTEAGVAFFNDLLAEGDIAP
ncbi:hypothetical protein LG197_22325 [Pseudomonas asiatica]|uniref:Uncharacterized protein n=1 Tax=Pseudomonas monteilii TaxID=76759 RepID=A0A2N1IN24_9PSED|nr:MULTISPECIES: hypothetical protein [Pseudomonas]PKI19660.1 hypothetical protein CXB65_21640 [Pseudomonas monteilii]RPD93826.1 hypothetical protein EGN69_13200 [Pseudomonas monteilii]WDM87332.1 hypothetical protein LG197_22325 [Pseudomonas asiatica]